MGRNTPLLVANPPGVTGPATKAWIATRVAPQSSGIDRSNRYAPVSSRLIGKLTKGGLGVMILF